MIRQTYVAPVRCFSRWTTFFVTCYTILTFEPGESSYFYPHFCIPPLNPAVVLSSSEAIPSCDRTQPLNKKTWCYAAMSSVIHEHLTIKRTQGHGNGAIALPQRPTSQPSA